MLSDIAYNYIIEHFPKTKEEFKDVINRVVKMFLETNEPSLLEAEFVIKANDQFHLIADRVKEKEGKLDNARILFQYTEWLRREAKKKNRE